MNLSFVTIGTSSLTESINFYQEVLDFKLEKKLSPLQGVKIAFMTDQTGSKIELIERGPLPPNITSFISLGFEVEDIEKTKKHLEEHNVNIVAGPEQLPSGIKILRAHDPSNVNLSFIEHN